MAISSPVCLIPIPKRLYDHIVPKLPVLGNMLEANICILSVLLIGRSIAIICKTDSKHISTIYKTFLFIICGKGNKKA